MNIARSFRFSMRSLVLFAGSVLVLSGCGSEASSDAPAEVPQAVQDEMKASDDFMKAQATKSKK